MKGTEEYREFNTEEEVEQWAEDNYGAWLKRLKKNKYDIFSHDIADILNFYTGNMNLIFNRFLRGRIKCNKKESNDYNSKINIINKEISRFETAENIVVWRYTDKRFFQSLFENRRVKVGTIFTEKGFMSTTLMPEKLESFAENHHYNLLLKIYLPEGTKGAYIDFENDGLDENEFLLPSGCQFRLIKKRYRIFHKPHYIYECRYVKRATHKTSILNKEIIKDLE